MHEALAKRLSIILLSTVSLTGAGCLWGPTTLKHNHTYMNRAFQETAREEMLLNLVRMKYRDSIEFVKISSITDQHTFTGGVGLRFPFTSIKGPGTADIIAQSKPTSQYQPEQNAEFNQRLQSRLGPETLDLLASKGWAADRVLRVTIRTINDVDNATSAGGPTPELKPDFERFRFMANQIRELQRHRQIELGYELLKDASPAPVADAIDAKLVGGQEVLAAAERGYQFRRDRNGRMVLWTQPKPTPKQVLRVTPNATTSYEMQQIVDILELAPGQEFYPFVLDELGQLKKPSSIRYGHSTPFGGHRDKLSVSTRSMIEMMYYLSHAIEVPDSHIKKGLVTRTFDANGQEFDWRCMTGDLLEVKVSHFPQPHAAVSVHYRGLWFYIADDDLSSKTTFNLLLELFNLKLRAGGGAQVPLLTI